MVSEDLQEFSANKLVLSACSSFFQQILQSRSQQQERLVLFLSTVNSRDLSNILEFIYQGALNVPADEVDQFISAGNILKIKGIYNSEDGLVKLAEEKPKKRKSRKKKVRESKDADPDPDNDETALEAETKNVEDDKSESNQDDQTIEEDNINVDQAHGLEEEEDTADKAAQDEEIIIEGETSSFRASCVVDVKELEENYSKEEILKAYNKMMALKKMKGKQV